jgi:hypothetical protein
VTIFLSPSFKVHFYSFVKHPTVIYIIPVIILKRPYATPFPASAEIFMSSDDCIKPALDYAQFFFMKNLPAAVSLWVKLPGREARN